MKTRIKELAKNRGFKVRELSEACGVSKRTMYNWFDGKISIDDLVLVASVLECSFYELLEPVDGLNFVYDQLFRFRGLSK